MTIDQAIEVLTKIAEDYAEDWLDFEYAALKLGIEALKVVKEQGLGYYLVSDIEKEGGKR